MYKQLLINDFEDSYINECVGVICFLFKNELRNNGLSYIPSRFIKVFNDKVGFQIPQYLISAGYIDLYVAKELDMSYKDKLLVSYRNVLEANGYKYEPRRAKKTFIIDGVNHDNYKKEPKLYYPLKKLQTLSSGFVSDSRVVLLIQRNIHHFNGWRFNHWYYNYRNIKIDIPLDKLNQLPIKSNLALKFWGYDFPEYHIKLFGFDHSHYKLHYNLFTYKNPPLNLLKYTDLKQPTLVGLKDGDVMILGHLLYLAFGNNELRDFFLKKNIKYVSNRWANHILKKYYEYEDWELDKQTLVRNKELFTVPEDFDFFKLFDNEVFAKDWYRNAVYGSRPVSQFKDLFPIANEMLFHLKGGGYRKNAKGGSRFVKKTVNGVTFMSKDCFYDFVKPFNPKIFHNDWRIALTKDSTDVVSNQPFYKVVRLAVSLYASDIMHSIFMDLKKYKVRFVPIHTYVAVDSENAICAEHIIKKRFLEKFDQNYRLKVHHLEF
jgi:hypothetical protein